ncbi:transposase [Altererythrobacter sp. ZODW24]|uniref:transposase n=1 Tax=Altererythrobacter sp. ZODW24 TaxID=2185142 RepID=UPI0019641869|nr:transposase [Altererythrobacter sp. ZODW24]
MPRVMEVAAAPPCNLDECITAITDAGFEPGEEESLQHGANWLARLGRNKSFLGDMMLDELANRHCEDDPRSAYGPQVIMLSRPAEGFFMRANIWPSAQEHSYRASGSSSFVYDLPHDHNFDFLTVGYFGPGYESDYYEYDFDKAQGYPGEKANLRFVERSALSEGRVLHYRAHRDVHRQLPPKSLSVSLNILKSDPAQGWFDQYRFDIERDEIAGIISHGSGEVFLRCAVGMGGAEAVDIAERFGHQHPSDRMRLAAWEARASLCGDDTEQDALWRDAERSGSRMIAMEAKRRRAALAET